MDIPHMQERLQLAALYKQVFDLMDEEDQALAPLNGDALAAAHRAFRAKRDAIREDMKTIENAIGASLRTTFATIAMIFAPSPGCRSWTPILWVSC